MADGYIQLLQMTVLPYVTVSLIEGMGRLSYHEAKLLFTRVGAVVLLLWSLALLVIFCVPLAYPQLQSASFYSTSLLTPPETFDFLGLYIPANPFRALSENLVPAVVLFSLATGIALIGVEDKAGLLDNLAVINKALAAINRFVVRLAPFGVFAIAANVAGTMSLHELARVQVFVVTYVVVAVLFTFWTLPGLIAALTPVRYRRLLDETRDALVTAFMTNSLFVVLPMLIEATTTLLKEEEVAGQEAESLPEVIVPISFNFPHVGKVISLSFILFAAWFSDVVISLREYPLLAVAGIASFFGSVNVAVPFLLDLFRIPADVFELFLATGVVNSRFGTLLSAMHTVTVALLGTAAVAGGLRIRASAVLRYVAVTAALTVAALGGAHLLFTKVLRQEYRSDKVLMSMQPIIRASRPATLYREAPPGRLEREDGESLLERIDRRGAIRVGYRPDYLPYSFFNTEGELVGFDVEMAYRLADELHVDLELVPIDRQRVAAQLDGSYCDLAMAPFAVTTERARHLLFCRPHVDETFAFVVLDHRRAEFASLDAVRGMTSLRVGYPDIPGIRSFLRELLPAAEIEPSESIEALFDRAGAGEVDAVALTAEEGSAWCLLHPEFSVVVPQPHPPRVPLAYIVADDDERFRDFVNVWLDIRTKDGTVRELYDHWILGRDTEPHPRRWSVVRDVLHWVE